MVRPSKDTQKKRMIVDINDLERERTRVAMSSFSKHRARRGTGDIFMVTIFPISDGGGVVVHIAM